MKAPFISCFSDDLELFLRKKQDAGFLYYYMHHAVRAARTIVHVVVVHQRRLLADDILWLNYLISIHSLTSFSLKHQQFPRAQEQYHQDGRTAPQEWHHSQPDGHPVPSVLH